MLPIKKYCDWILEIKKRFKKFVLLGFICEFRPPLFVLEEKFEINGTDILLYDSDTLPIAQPTGYNSIRVEKKLDDILCLNSASVYVILSMYLHC